MSTDDDEDQGPSAQKTGKGVLMKQRLGQRRRRRLKRECQRPLSTSARWEEGEGRRRSKTSEARPPIISRPPNHTCMPGEHHHANRRAVAGCHIVPVKAASSSSSGPGPGSHRTSTGSGLLEGSRPGLPMGHQPPTCAARTWSRPRLPGRSHPRRPPRGSKRAPAPEAAGRPQRSPASAPRRTPHRGRDSSPSRGEAEWC